MKKFALCSCSVLRRALAGAYFYDTGCLSIKRLLLMLLMAAAVSITCGCSSLAAKHLEPDRAAIEERFSDLDLSRGASREDAVIIAQHYMLSKGYDYDWWIESPAKVDDDPKQNIWTVEFAPKEDGYGSGPRPRPEVTFQMLLPYWVTINKDSGKLSVLVIKTKHERDHSVP